MLEKTEYLTFLIIDSILLTILSIFYLVFFYWLFVQVNKIYKLCNYHAIHFSLTNNLLASNLRRISERRRNATNDNQRERNALRPLAQTLS
jgi:hypothetical protein